VSSLNPVYSKTPVTVTPDRLIPPDAPRSRGMDDAAAQEVADMSASYATDLFEIALSPGAGLEWFLHPTLNDAAIDLTESAIDVTWGDGTGERLTVEPAAHTYAARGTYGVFVTLRRPGQPTLQREAIATP
jgi:hypothetical protein